MRRVYFILRKNAAWATLRTFAISADGRLSYRSGGNGENNAFDFRLSSLTRSRGKFFGLR